MGGRNLDQMDHDGSRDQGDWVDWVDWVTQFLPSRQKMLYMASTAVTTGHLRQCDWVDWVDWVDFEI
jgi:hypothetical protein